MRRRLGELADVGRNGHNRGAGIQELISPRDRRARRRLLAGAVMLIGFAAMGARHCRTVQAITAEQRRRARVDVYIACHIHGCSAERLAGLLHQLDAMRVTEGAER